MMKAKPRVLVTPGEPAGIGPDVVVQIAQQDWRADIVVIASPDLLLARARQLNLPLQLIEFQENDTALHQPGTLKIIPVAMNVAAQAGRLDPANAFYVLNTLKLAAALCQHQKAHAIVTGPVHKGMINDAGVSFRGHTEFFAELAGVEQTVMLFVVDHLKIALATTHVSLQAVPKAITKNGLQAVIKVLNNGLKEQFQLVSPQIAVCGLNPHAGEGGHLGCEEINIISPALVELREQGYKLLGPLPADTAFTPHHREPADAILAMYHDQALPLVKYIGFDRAVNMTLGLPYLRTSVDHGTAIDLAGTGRANAGSMRAALALAISLSA